MHIIKCQPFPFYIKKTINYKNKSTCLLNKQEEFETVVNEIKKED